MDAAISSCYAEFRRVGLEMQFATHRLESEMADAVAAGRSCDAERTRQAHPLTVLRRVRAAAERAAALSARAQAVQAERAQVVPALEAAVAENEELVGRLRAVARLPAAAPDANDENAPPAPASPPQKQLSPVQHQQQPPALEPASPEEPAAPAAPVADDKLPRDAFEALPASVRGRCRYDDVLRTFEGLEAIVARLPRSARSRPVSRQDLDAHGLRVAGKTGDSILASLRALGLVQLGRGGGVRLL